MVKFIADNFGEITGTAVICHKFDKTKRRLQALECIRMIKYLLLIISVVLSASGIQAQNISGQWKGEFWDKSSKFGSFSGDKCEYVLELEVNGKKITGYSYTYFYYGEQKYYTICKLSGTYDKSKKYVEVKEFERTKTNVPDDLNNCFQIHRLSFYKKTGGDESLEGSWIPVPDQKGSCGYGITQLTRRNLRASFPNFRNPIQNNTAANSISRVNPQGSRAPVVTKKITPPVAKKPPVVVKKPAISIPPANTERSIAKRDTNAEQREIRVPKPTMSATIIAGNKYEKRNNHILKTIDVEAETVKIDLYDNGEIDGDSISVFLNGKLLLSRKRLTAQPLTIKLHREDLEASNDLVMYAENLGSIPPNTALMVVTDGARRYEVRITSDLQKSGAIRFIKKEQ
jgi:hypothetical protein